MATSHEFSFDPSNEASVMQITATLSTKGGTGKTTGSSNLGALSADAGLRTLLIDLDTSQPTVGADGKLTHPAD